MAFKLPEAILNSPRESISQSNIPLDVMIQIRFTTKAMSF